MSTPRTEGRLKAFRLSDIDIEIRLDAARVCADAERRHANDQLDAIFETVKIDLVAQDPIEAARTMPTECRNELRFVSMEEWERVMGKRKRRR